jgi:5'-3' exonuclease
MQTSLLLVDLSAIFWTKWHGAAGQPIDTAFEYTVGKVRQLATGFEKVAVCCDTGRSFRYDINPTYKAKRPPKDEAALAQLARVRGELSKLGFTLIEEDGFEGDDLIATMVVWSQQQDPPLRVVIAGMDKDLLALLDERVLLLHLQSGNTWGPAEVKQKFGVMPAQMRDYLALVGDTSDNIKGVPKIGKEHAARLLVEFGSAEALVSALDQMGEDGEPKVKPPAIRKSLLDNLGLLDEAIQLVALRTDVPIDCAALFAALGAGEPAAPSADAAASLPAHPQPQPQPPERVAAPPPAANRPPASNTKDAAASRFAGAKVSRAPDKSAHKFILTGRSGIGKTFFVSTIPGVFILPIEEGLKGVSLDHNPAHFQDERGRDIIPRTLVEFCQAVDRFQAMNVPPEPGQARPFAHLAVDSLSGLEMLVHEAACGAEKAQHMEAKDFKKVWHAAEPLWRQAQRKLDAVRHTGVHVWMIAHSAETVDAALSGDTFRKWDLLLKGTGPTGVEARQLWRQWADHVFFLDWVAKVVKGDKTRRAVGKYEGRILHTRESATHYAKTRGRLPASLPATWEDLHRAMTAGVTAPDAKLRAQIQEIVPQLPDEDREAIEAELGAATGPSRLAAILSRAQGMLAIAMEDMPPADAEDTGAAA